MTPHNEAKIGEIAKTVIMPGDPLRAKYIAETFLTEYRLVNQVRNMLAYTGKYKGKEITVMAHGMGMPSVGIYSYELYKHYDVDHIIRIGSCGAYVPELNLFDIVLSDKVYTEGNYALTMNNVDCHLIEADNDLNNLIEETSKEIAIPIVKGNTACTDFVDFYMKDPHIFKNRLPKELNIISAEMEAFALFYNAKVLHKKAACLMSVVDSEYISRTVSATERQLGLTNMITVALESSLKL